MKHILITGANGFIGSHLCRYLEENGYRLRRCFRTPSLDVGENDVVTGDINALTYWIDALDGIDTVIHLAGEAHNTNKKGYNAPKFMKVNYEGTQKLAYEAASFGVRRFIFLSSIAVYGAGVTQITDSTKPQPDTLYGVSKLQAEMAIQSICKDSQMNYVTLRPPLVYGPDAPGNIARLKKLISLGLPLPFASIKNKRSLISVMNLASIIHACIEDVSVRNEMFLVSDTVELSTCDLIRMLAAEMGRPCFFFQFSERWLNLLFKCIGLSGEFNKAFGSLVLDVKRLERTLNWSPVETPLEAILNSFR